MSAADLLSKRQELEESVEQTRYELDEGKVQQEMLVQQLQEGESSTDEKVLELLKRRAPTGEVVQETQLRSIKRVVPKQAAQDAEVELVKSMNAALQQQVEARQKELEKLRAHHGGAAQEAQLSQRLQGLESESLRKQERLELERRELEEERARGREQLAKLEEEKLALSRRSGKARIEAGTCRVIFEALQRQSEENESLESSFAEDWKPQRGRESARLPCAN